MILTQEFVFTSAKALKEAEVEIVIAKERYDNDDLKREGKV